MRELRLVRLSTGINGTLGQLLDGKELHAHTMEPRWLDNRPYVSCIPAGSYLCAWDWFPNWKWRYRICGVQDRTDTLIHPGNWGGDRREDLMSDTQGCILLGHEVERINGQIGVTNSRATTRAVEARMNHEPFLLAITWNKGVEPDDAKQE